MPLPSPVVNAPMNVFIYLSASVSSADPENFAQDGHLNDPPNFLLADSFDDHVSALKPILESMLVVELVTCWLGPSVGGDTHYRSG